MPTLDKIKVWALPDETVRVTYFLKEAFELLKKSNPKITEDEFIENQTQAIIESRNEYKTFKIHTKLKTELKQIILGHPQGHIERLKIKPDGTLFIDPNIRLRWEITREKINALNEKLKGLGLNDDEINIVLKQKRKK